MSKGDTTAVTVRILDKEYQVACQEHEKNALLDSARYLDERMREIRNTGKVIGSDRVAVMAALNITYDLLQSKSKLGGSQQLESDKIKQLQNKVEVALDRSRQLEF